MIWGEGRKERRAGSEVGVYVYVCVQVLLLVCN